MATKTMSTPSVYREVIKRAFQITRQYKFLWFFAFFAAALGAGGDLEPLFTGYTRINETAVGVSRLQDFYQGGFIESIYNSVKMYFSVLPGPTLLFLFVIIAVTIIIIWLAIISQIALFDSINKINGGKQVGYLEGYKIGNRHFGSVLLVNIIAKVLVYGLLVAIAAPLLSWFLVRNSVWGSLLFMILVFLVFIPFSVVISFIIKYAVAYIVIEGQKVGQAIRSSWSLFKKNWLVSLEMAFIILILGVVVGLCILILLGLAAVPFALIGITALFFGSATTFGIALTLGGLTWLVIIALVGSMYAAFQYAAWTLLFLRLVDNKAESKLVRWFSKLSFGKA